MVRTRGVRAGGHDGEVHTVVTLGKDPTSQLGGHVGFRTTDERDLTLLQRGGDAIHRRRGLTEGGDLFWILYRAQRSHDVTGVAELRGG